MKERRECALCEPDAARFAFYTRDAISRAEISADHTMVVNSLPKSGSIWIMAMLRHLFDFGDCDNPHLIHVGDIRDAGEGRPVFGVVVVVRDLRDVVLSWHHETLRNDARAGFFQPRYPTVDAFYFEHLIGFLQSEARYEYGHLTDWLDFVTGRGFPLIRYEDMRRDPLAALRKIITFWKVIVSEKDLRTTVGALTFDRMPEVAAKMGGLIGETIANGHLQRGQVGRWKNELPERVSNDIANRFGNFQTRLGYV